MSFVPQYRVTNGALPPPPPRNIKVAPRSLTMLVVSKQNGTKGQRGPPGHVTMVVSFCLWDIILSLLPSLRYYKGAVYNVGRSSWLLTALYLLIYISQFIHSLESQTTKLSQYLNHVFSLPMMRGVPLKGPGTENIQNQ